MADAALGYACCLDPIWDAGALRMVDLRAAPGDEDPQIRLRRGYDEEGHPLCLHGYAMRSNGHDYDRRRTKWCCQKGCRKDSQRPAPDCPYLSPAHRHGQVVNVGRRLPDGTVRLAREVAYGSRRWKKRYGSAELAEVGRRNLSESRNGSMEGMGFKRLPSFGLRHGGKEVAIGDFVNNLRTLGRLVQEATVLALRAGAG